MYKSNKSKKSLYCFWNVLQDFLNFKPLVENEALNWKTSTDNQLNKCNNVKVVSTSLEKPFILNINYSLDTNSNLITINIILKKNKGRNTTYSIPIKAYKGEIPTDKLKLNGLLSLCNKRLIPSAYHSVYHSLVTV